MADRETFGSFFSQNKKLIKEYMDARLEIYRLQLIRGFSKSAGHFLWVLISLVLLSLLIIFGGLVTGFWLSEVTGSYTKGFGFTTLIIVVVILILALLRRILFVNPIIRAIINHNIEKGEDPQKEDKL